MKRYFAVQRMPWGLQHIEAGQELTDPDPDSVPQLRDLVVKQGAVRVEEVTEKPKAKAAPAYKRRDLQAEEPKPEQAAPAAADATEEAPPRRGRRIGAMTTADEPGITTTKNDE